MSETKQTRIRYRVEYPSQYTDIPSFAFENDYCIFISKKAAPHFAQKINATSWRHQSVAVFESTDNKDDLAVIVIPRKIDFWKVEECLFEFKTKNTNKDVVDSGFWGQYDMGYKNKTWNLIEFWEAEEKKRKVEIEEEQRALYEQLKKKFEK